LSTFTATGSQNSDGILLPGNWSRTKPEPDGFGRVVKGLKIRTSDPLAAKVWEKSP
jgi:hypothetical protein